MKRNALIATDNIWYKVSNFFRKMFNMNKKHNDKASIRNDNICVIIKNSDKDNSIVEMSKKDTLAKKLMQGEIDINKLSNLEVAEMTEYFDRYVNEMNKKLEYIKKNIVNLREKA